MDEIKTRVKSNFINEHIHLMWYCISYESKRIEKEEVEWILLFSKKMPDILVLTQCISDDETVSKELDKLNLPVVNRVELLASPKKLKGNTVVRSWSS